MSHILAEGAEARKAVGGMEVERPSVVGQMRCKGGDHARAGQRSDFLKRHGKEMQSLTPRGRAGEGNHLPVCLQLSQHVDVRGKEPLRKAPSAQVMEQLVRQGVLCSWTLLKVPTGPLKLLVAFGWNGHCC